MSSVSITPTKLHGTIHIPSSKSVGHRLILSASLGQNEVVLSNVYQNDDILATIGAMEALGAEFSLRDASTLVVTPVRKREKGAKLIHCNQSGSTLRFLIPIAMTLYDKAQFMGSQRLMERPLDEYFKIFSEVGILFALHDNILSLQHGPLKSGIYSIKGDVSSQYITGLLYALSLMEHNSKLTVEPPFYSRAYVDITVDVLKKSGIEITQQNDIYSIAGGQKFCLPNCSVEGDYSQAAFFLVAGALGCAVECIGLNPDSLQGDKEILDIVQRAGCEIKIQTNAQNAAISVIPPKDGLRALNIDANQIPDLVPILTVLGCAAGGTTVITGAKRLKDKESNRLLAISLELNKLGADIEMTDDGLIIKGTGVLRGGETNSHDDHRIAMSVAIASVLCQEKVEIHNSECVNKSFPTFFDEFEKLGAMIKKKGDHDI